MKKNGSQLAEIKRALNSWLSPKTLFSGKKGFLEFGSDFRFVIRSRETGLNGNGTARLGWDNAGTASVDLGGEHYEGKWVYAEDNTTRIQSVKQDSTIGFAMTRGGQGFGNVILTSSSVSEKQIVCEFKFDESTGQGGGVCRDNQNLLYDLEIYQK